MSAHYALMVRGISQMFVAGPPVVARVAAPVTKEETADYCERVLRGYQERRQPGERFAAYVARADEEWLL